MEYDGLSMPRRVFAIVAITLGVFSSTMNATIANVALPVISECLSITSADSIWVVNVYQIATIVFLLPCSAIGEMYSYKRMLLCGLVLFTSSSFLCALSTSLSMLLLFRVMQGLGSAMMVSVNMSIIKLTYPRRYLAQGIGINSTFVALSAVAGPAIASLIMSVASWPWLFAVNVPIGLLAVLLGVWALPENVVRVGRSFPKVDALLNGLFFGALMVAMECMAHSMSVVLLVVLVVVFVVVAGVYIPRQMSQSLPLLPFDLLRNPVFSISILTSVSSFVAQMTAMVSIPFFLHEIVGYSVAESGLLYTAWPLVIMVTAPLSGFMMNKVHAGVLGGIGQMLIISGLVSMSMLGEGASKLDVVWRMMLCGAGFGIFQSPNNSVIMSSAPQQRNGSASGMLATARLVGQTTGATLVAMMFTYFGVEGSRYSLLTAAVLALVACVLSLSRRGMELPTDMNDVG